MRSVRVDEYVFETLMADLVLHDHHPSAFLVYLHLWHQSAGRRPGRVRASHQQMANATGLSKSAVQAAIRTLTRRKLIRTARTGATAMPEYTVLHPWRR
jgi:transcription initiation factor IIE alpha subunit